jgi:UDP-N-acetylglucosamine--N-acetylmuramyl-(pentapeptide) pyrophosphoryl-undecaprenol N-acetylglucosamine transferase
VIQAEVQTFFDDVPRRITDAQLVISRSGASTVADVSVIGRPAIWVPLASAIRDEQTANARQLVEAGGAVMMTEAEFDVAPLTQKLTELLSDGHAALKMSQAATACGVPDATERLVQLVENLAEAGKK